MNVGKKVRLNRLFSHASGRLCAVAVDHFIGYDNDALPAPLSAMADTLAQIVAGAPDAVTMHRGVAASVWPAFAGKIPFILQGILGKPDDSVYEQIADPEDAVIMGADAFAVTGFVRGRHEARYLKTVAEAVRAARKFEMPVVVHIYPRRFGEKVEISFDPDDVAWAVHCALECGVDIIKTPYCNDVAAFAQIVAGACVPVVAAGGPRKRSFEDALEMLREVVSSGAAGATVGRNAWGAANITEAVKAICAVIHTEKPQKARPARGSDPS